MIDQHEAVRTIRAKVARAAKHLEQLDTEMVRFNEERPYELRRVDQPKSGEFVYRFFYKRPLPVEWNVVLGEIVHDLRSALDHAVYQLWVDNGKKPDGSGFPIFYAPGDFAKYGEGMIRGTTPEAQAFIRSLQPDGTKNNASRSLLVLHKLSTQDKHKLIQPWGVQINVAETTVEFTAASEQIEWASGVLHHGAEAFRVKFRHPMPNDVKMNGEIAFQMAFDDPLDPIGADDGRLAGICDYASGIVSILLSMIGNQDTPPI